MKLQQFDLIGIFYVKLQELRKWLICIKPSSCNRTNKEENYIYH